MADISHFFSPTSVLGATALNTCHLVGGAPIVGASADFVARPFEPALEADLAGGALSQLFDIDGSLEYLRNESAGDPAVFFRVSGLRWRQDSTIIDLSFIVRDEDGGGHPETSHHEIPDKTRMPHDRLMTLDLAVCEVTHKYGDRLFAAPSRRVFFKAADGRELSARYVFSPSADAAIVGSRLLNGLGIETSSIAPSAAPNAYWLREDGTTFYDLIEQGAGGCFVEYLNAQFSTQDGLEALQFMGDVSMAMFLLGGNHLQLDDVSFGGGGSFGVRRFDTVGMPFISSFDEIRDPRHFVEYCFREGIWTLFGRGRKRDFLLPDRFYRAYLDLFDGAALAFNRLLQAGAKNREASPPLVGVFHPRLVLNAADHFSSGREPLLHLSVPADAQSIKRMIDRRAKIVSEAFPAGEEVPVRRAPSKERHFTGVAVAERSQAVDRAGGK